MRSPRDLALDIRADYARKGKPVHYSAKPYVDAMAQLDSWFESFHADDALTCAVYAFSNLSTWRGDEARAIKAEWKAIYARLR